MTESSSIGLIVFNGGVRTLRKRDDRSRFLLLDDSSANVFANFLTAVLISVLNRIFI
jgi:hypothetical protein